jgi:DNA mismatch endonuclease (patch repair protein)
MGLSRSKQMSRIRGANTRPERLVAKALWARGLRYRLRTRTRWGRPDIVFGSRKIAVFVDGCFWHGCPEHYVRPRSRTSFWGAKLEENVRRDRTQTRALEAAGWVVLRFWEHDIFTRPNWVANRVARACAGWRVQHRVSWRVLSADAVSADGNVESRTLVPLRGSGHRVCSQRRHTRKW